MMADEKQRAKVRCGQAVFVPIFATGLICAGWLNLCSATLCAAQSGSRSLAQAPTQVPAQAPSQASTLSGSGSLVPTEYDKSLVDVFQRSDETPPVYWAVARAVAALPPGVKDTLAKAGVRWKVVPTLSSYDSRFDDMQARGWKEGNTFRNVAGTYSKVHNEVLIAVRAIRPKDNVMAPRGHRFQTTLHETGHGYDNILGMFSRSAEFRNAYNDDIARLTGDQRIQLKYYLQAQNAGPSECFAELFAEGVMRAAGIQPELPEILQFFPRSFEVVRRILR